MKCIPVTSANGPLEVVEREKPAPRPGQIGITIEACGICHSDVFVASGGFEGLELPRVPGHEIAGRVDVVGEGVAAWKVGDRVGVGWHGGHCFKCDACRTGDFLNCIEEKITGITHDGGWADYVVVPWESAARIPEGLPAEDAGPLLCAGVTTYNALRNSVAGWPSGSAIDSEATMKFSVLTGVRPKIEQFPLAQAGEALAKVLSNEVRFRAVLVP